MNNQPNRRLHFALLFSRFTIYALLFVLLLGDVHPQGEVTITLQRAIELALQNSEDVLKAEKILERARANLKTARAVYFPQVGLTGFYEKSKNNDANIDEEDYLSRAVISQLIARFGVIPDDLDRAEEDIRRAGLELESAKKQVVYTLRQLWHNIGLTEAEIEQRSQVSQALEQKLRGAQRKHAEKRIPMLSVLNTELELSEQRLALNELTRRLDIDKAELSRLTGLDPLVNIHLSGSVPEDDFSLEASVELALANRLELRDLEGAMRRQERLMKETIWNRLPELSADLRYRDVHLQLQQQDRTWDAKAVYDPAIIERDILETDPFRSNINVRDGWEVRVNWNLSLFDGKETEGLRDAERAELDRLGLELQDIQKRIRVDVRRDYREVANAKERMEIEDKRVQIFEQRLRTIERVLDEGLDLPSYRGLTFDDAFEAQAQFTEAQRIFYQVRRDHALAKEKLRQTMGWIE